MVMSLQFLGNSSAMVWMSSVSVTVHPEGHKGAIGMEQEQGGDREPVLGTGEAAHSAVFSSGLLTTRRTLRFWSMFSEAQ